ncbi:baseplate J/gp47 family protein [Vibrio jasicida]|uniref:baseplate J/gp47 family protein n=1 Tax=Vibrio jasicida TaxID=766224 RepID=UPI0005F02ED2|nr:baseplate J/gp47 family protein [Vibrio jasicida]
MDLKASQEFEQVLKNSGIPVSEAEIQAEFEKEVVEQGSMINNNSTYSPFWRLIKTLITKPYLYLIQLLIKTVFPQSFVMHATGKWLDLWLDSVDLKRKQPNAAQGYVIFERLAGAPEILLPANFTISTDRINGKIYQLVIPEQTILPAGVMEVKVAVVAAEAGSEYNLSGGYYQIPQAPIAGLKRVYNPDDWLSLPGADIESNEDARARYRAQFTAVSGFYIDDKYKLIMSEFGGVKPDQIYIKRNGPRGPGTANAYLLLDSGTPAKPFIDKINQVVRGDGYHGLGDDMLVMELPEKDVDIECEWLPVPNLTPEQQASLKSHLEQYIRCVFRENKAYPDSMKTWPNDLFSFSTLNQELRNQFPQVESLYFKNRDFKTGLEIARINALQIKPMFE